MSEMVFCCTANRQSGVYTLSKLARVIFEPKTLKLHDMNPTTTPPCSLLFGIYCIYDFLFIGIYENVIVVCPLFEGFFENQDSEIYKTFRRLVDTQKQHYRFALTFSNRIMTKYGYRKLVRSFLCNYFVIDYLYCFILWNFPFHLWGNWFNWNFYLYLFLKSAHDQWHKCIDFPETKWQLTWYVAKSFSALMFTLWFFKILFGSVSHSRYNCSIDFLKFVEQLIIIAIYGAKC